MKPSRRSAVDPFIVMDVMERARAAEAAGRSVVHMEVGQPATAAPAGARAALAEAMKRGPLGYTVALGLPALRERIARHYGEAYGVDLNPARVVVTSGSSAGFILAFTALFDAGDRIALGAPGYPSYRQIMRAQDLVPVTIPTDVATRFQPTPDALPEAEGLMIASPSNPAGTVLDRAALGALIEAARSKGMSVISDEIYHGLTYGDRAISALEITDDAVVINSFSKYFSMTGWRIGWMVVPEGMVRTMERLAQNMFICPPHASQVAALAAMDCRAELEANRAVYAENRRILLEGLPGAGLPRFAPPDGAFYVYADVSHLTDDSLGFCNRMLDEAGVAITPGIDFDAERGGRFVRLSYAGSTEDIAEGLRRIGGFLGSAR